jgi:hypothetical protein
MLNKASLDLIKSFEGLKLTAYLCPANVPTIGYGTTKGLTRADVGKKTISQAEAERLSYKMEKKYLPDWIDTANKRIVEAKGLFTAEDRAKHKALKAQYPEWEITIVFQNAGRTITKTSKTSYSNWCNANGIKWKQA